MMEPSKLLPGRDSEKGEVRAKTCGGSRAGVVSGVGMRLLRQCRCYLCARRMTATGMIHKSVVRLAVPCAIDTRPTCVHVVCGLA
jgi:hypothetical protein